MAEGDFGKPAAARLAQRNARIAADLRSMTTAAVAKKYGVSRYTVWRASIEKESS